MQKKSDIVDCFRLSSHSGIFFVALSMFIVIHYSFIITYDYSLSHDRLSVGGGVSFAASRPVAVVKEGHLIPKIVSCSREAV